MYQSISPEYNRERKIKTLGCKEIPGFPKKSYVSFSNSEQKNVKVNVQFQIILRTSNFHYSAVEEGHLSR